jgi:methyl acetate hydrolase
MMPVTVSILTNQVLGMFVLGRAEDTTHMSYLRFLTLMCAIMCVACDNTSDTSSITDVLESGVKGGRIPGVIGIAATPDEIIYQGAAGVLDVSNGEPMKVDTIVRIASMTKAITSVAIMQLLEQEKLQLDDSVGQYLPRFADAQVLEGFDADDKPILRPATSPVTVRHLLTHTSGYVYEIWNADAGRNVALGNVASISAGGDAFVDAPLSFDPGTQWEYGIGTDILGILIEVISGQSLDVYFQQQIFTPLKMQDTFFNVPEEKQHRVATVHAKSVDGELTPIPFSRRKGGFFSGGGGLLSTAGDYTRFLQAMLNAGELGDARILNGSTVHLMAQNHIGELEAANSILSSAPSLSNDVNIFPDSVDKFGLGFLINTDPVPGGRSAGSLAWAGMYNSYYWIDMEKGICGVLITQILPFYDADVVTLLDNFEKSVYAVANQ